MYRIKLETPLKSKLILLEAIILFAFSVLLIRAFYIQVYNREKLVYYSKSQVLREVKKNNNRGRIFDRLGMPLAINEKTYSIFTFPMKQTNVYDQLSKLHQITGGFDLEQTYKKVSQRNKHTWIARRIKLSDPQVENIQKIDGIFIEENYKRFYPNNSLLSQVIGFVGTDNKGLEGIEYLYNNELAGSEQIIRYFKDAKGRPIRYMNSLKQDSQDIYLSIDRNIQQFLEKAIQEAATSSKAAKVGAGVIDAETGEILAIANYPSFDANKIDPSERSNFKLSFVTDPFEPGSIFKPFVVASGLENKIITKDSLYFCEKGKFQINKHIITEAEEKKQFGWLKVSEIIEKSSNIGMVKIAFDLTFPLLRKTLENFGFNEKTGVQLLGESRGIFPKSELVDPLRLSNISFGHGIAVTGIQLLRAFAVIANNGQEVNPKIVLSGEDEMRPEAPKRRILSRDINNDLISMLVDVVENGTGKKAKVPNAVIAGKTGTAQKIVGGEYKGYISSFIGFPVNVDKRFVVMVYVDNPTGAQYYGGDIAAPVFKKIVEYILYQNEYQFKLNHLVDWPNILIAPPILDKIEQRKKSLASGIMPDLKGLDKKSISHLFKGQGIKISFKGAGIVDRQVPISGSKLGQSDNVTLYFTQPTYEL